MCISPIRVRNSKQDFNYNCDRPFNVVACGKCAECQFMKRKDMELRSLVEYEHTKRIGGMSFFYTLTYNEDNLPMVEFPDGQMHATFSKRDIQLFLKRLRKELTNNYNISLRFLCCTEYGDLHNRPHYHFIFHTNNHISSILFHDLVEKHWAKGFVMPGKFNNGVVTDTRAIRYVTKYVTKDISFYNEYKEFFDFQPYRDICCAIKSSSNLCVGENDLEDYILRSKLADYIDDIRYYKALHDAIPFVLKSQNFGASLYEMTDKFIIKNGKVIFMDNRKGKIKQFEQTLPSYYVNKFYYHIQKIPAKDNIEIVLNKDDFKLVRKPGFSLCRTLSASGVSNALSTKLKSFNDFCVNTEVSIQSILNSDYKRNLSDSQLSFLSSIGTDDIAEFGMHTLFNNGYYEECNYLSVVDAFICRHSVVPYCDRNEYIDKNIRCRITRFTELYDIIYQYHRYIGTLKCKEMEKKDKLKKVYSDYIKYY